ncbi:MAG: PepSY-associated TM helix domain-containing protein [Achromobacter mucicolens]|uniref:PepSY-associated TM helix domain-containing protein n=1 Tax=Achromobacter mucicolens TaxID=1389922 RepID=UPI003D0C91C3
MTRKAWAGVHRYMGLTLLVLLLVNAVTGSVLAFQHELDRWLNPGLFTASRQGAALPPDALIARVEAADPRLRVTLLPLDTRPGDAIELRVAARPHAAAGAQPPLDFDRLFVDRATGTVLGQRKWGAFRMDRPHFMGWMNQLHRTFHLTEPWGRWVVGGLALAWLFASLIGAWLTLPALPQTARAFWNRWKPAWQIKRGASRQRLTFDLHRAGGLWTLAAAIVLAVTGVYFNLGNEVFRPAVRLFSPITPHPVQSLPRQAGTTRPPAYGIAAAIAGASQHLPPSAKGFLPWYASHLPDKGVYRIAFKEDGMRERALRLRYEQIFIDDQTGALRGMTGYDSGTAADRFLIWQYPLHTGRILGWPGQVLVAVMGLVVAMLCVTGLLVWTVRRKARRARGST